MKSGIGYYEAAATQPPETPRILSFQYLEQILPK